MPDQRLVAVRRPGGLVHAPAEHPDQVAGEVLQHRQASAAAVVGRPRPGADGAQPFECGLEGRVLDAGEVPVAHGRPDGRELRRGCPSRPDRSARRRCRPRGRGPSTRRRRRSPSPAPRDSGGRRSPPPAARRTPAGRRRRRRTCRPSCGRAHGYFVHASSVARVRLSPSERPAGSADFASSRVRIRSVCALPSNPPQTPASASSTASPLWPNGGCPRSWARAAVSARSGWQPSGCAMSRATWATSRLWVSRLRTKSSAWGPSTWVLAASRRKDAECTTRARSRSNAVRTGAGTRLEGSATIRARACASYSASQSTTERGYAKRRSPRSGRAGRRSARNRAAPTRSRA